jgi:UDP-glucose 4-epimerase
VARKQSAVIALKYILVTGGTGFLGSIACVELLDLGYRIIILDNLSNSSIEVLDKIKLVSGNDVIFFKTDIRDEEGLNKIFSTYQIDFVIHFAGLKSVSHSEKFPQLYYDNNVNGTRVLLATMKSCNVKKIIFSSSASVYGDLETMPVNENLICNPSNPYAKSKLDIEKILLNLAKIEKNWSIVILRYFNPIGAHTSGLLGEYPNESPDNIMPCINLVAFGKKAFLNIFGSDYDTPDGSCIRDYIHVMDLIAGHIAAINFLNQGYGAEIFNLGTGQGTSVLELVKAFEDANGVNIPIKMAPRRQGDLPKIFADCNKANNLLNWRSKKNIAEMCTDSWNWNLKLKI